MVMRPKRSTMRDESWRIIAAHLLRYFQAEWDLKRYRSLAYDLPEMGAEEKSIFDTAIRNGWGWDVVEQAFAIELRRSFDG